MQARKTVVVILATIRSSFLRILPFYSGYNALGQPGTMTLGNGTTTTYTYTTGNARLKTFKTVQGSTVLQNLGATFDAGVLAAGIHRGRGGPGGRGLVCDQGRWAIAEDSVCLDQIPAGAAVLWAKR